MKIVICAACKSLLAAMIDPDQKQIEAVTYAHMEVCRASEAEYEQAIYDLKFQQITKGLDL